MTRGRKPIPTALKLARGNPGKRPINKHEPRPDVKLPTCPRHLQGEARKEWRRMGRKLLAHGLMTDLDVRAFELYCLTYERFLDAYEKMKQHGLVVLSPNKFPVQSPYLAIINRCQTQIERLLLEFGMTPGSRSRVVISEPGDDSAEAAEAREMLG